MPPDALIDSQALNDRQDLLTMLCPQIGPLPFVRLLAKTQSPGAEKRVSLFHFWSISTMVGPIGTGFIEDSVLQSLVMPWTIDRATLISPLSKFRSPHRRPNNSL